MPRCEWKEGGETLQGSLCCPRVLGSRWRVMHHLWHELLRELVTSRSRDLFALSEGASWGLWGGVGVETAAWVGMVGAGGCVLTGVAFLKSRWGWF